MEVKQREMNHKVKGKKSVKDDNEYNDLKRQMTIYIGVKRKFRIIIDKLIPNSGETLTVIGSDKVNWMSSMMKQMIMADDENDK